MARDGSNIYSPPAGSTATAGTTIESAKYNALIADIAADLNLARPIVAGGTGATTAAAALVNLGLTATAAELNTLDGITATVTELNYTDGVTSAIQTQLDAKIAASVMTTNGDIITRTAGVPARLALGADGTVLASNGTALAYRDASTRITNSLNLQTSVTANGIPAWAKRVTVAINSASTNGTSSVIVQLGTAATLATSGYLSASTVLGAATMATTNSTSGVLIDLASGDTASAVRSGVITFVFEASDKWSFSGSVASSASTHQCLMSGSINLTGALTRVRITTVGGTDTFDLGTMTVIYE